MAFRVVQISDTHLSDSLGYFVDNFDTVVAWLNAVRPDLVINTGDIALDAPRRPEDLSFALARHRDIEAPLLTLPGNHDLGDNPLSSDDPSEDRIDDVRRGVWQETFGEERFSEFYSGWHFVGCNAQLLGSGMPAESDQWHWLSDALAGGDNRPLALFLHKPLIAERPDESAPHGRYVLPEARRRLLDLLAERDLRLVACGHTHQFRERQLNGVAHVWAPSTAFILPDDMQPRLGEKRLGVVVYDFDRDGVKWQCVTPDGLTPHLISDFPDTYPGLVSA